MNWFWLMLSYLIMESIINGVFHIVSRKLKLDEKRGRSIYESCGCVWLGEIKILKKQHFAYSN